MCATSSCSPILSETVWERGSTIENTYILKSLQDIKFSVSVVYVEKGIESESVK
jgi:hypothetical protein